MTAIRPEGRRHLTGTERCGSCGAPAGTGRACTACAVRRPAAVPAPRPAPASTSGPMPMVDPPTVPVALPATPARNALALWVLAATLLVALALGVLALMRPDLFGLPSAPLFGGGPTDPAPGSAAVIVR